MPTHEYYYKEVKMVLAAELQLADEVRLSDNPYSTATVIQKTDEYVEFFRPYVQTSDFAYTGGVIPFIGIEQFKVYISDQRSYRLLERRNDIK